MPRRHRRLRWAQVLAFVVGVGGGTAAAAEPTEPRPPSTAPEDHAHTGRAQPGPDDPAADPTGNGATEESARTRTDWLASDGRALIAPPSEPSGDTRALWVAVLLGLGAGLGSTAVASVVVGNLDRHRPE